MRRSAFYPTTSCSLILEMGITIRKWKPRMTGSALTTRCTGRHLSFVSAGSVGGAVRCHR